LETICPLHVLLAGGNARMFTISIVVTGGCRELSGKLPVLNLLTGQKIRFSPRRGDSLHRFTSNLARPTGTRVRLAVQNFTSIATGGGNAAPNIKNFHF